MRDETDSADARRGSSWLAWSLAGLSLAICAASIALYILTRDTQALGGWGTGGASGVFIFLLPFLAFPVVGALIASKRPDNSIGWICLAIGIFWMLTIFATPYGAYGLVTRPGSVPFPAEIGSLGDWLWAPAVGLLGTYLILLVPDGRLLSRRWRPVAWLSGAVILLASAGVALVPEPLPDLGGIQNPSGLYGHPEVAYAMFNVLLLLPLCILASAASLILRVRRSGGEVREQIKWIAFAASLLGLGLLVEVVSALIVAPDNFGTGGTQPFWLKLFQDAVTLSYAGIPVAVGFAVLKYRLYDIDIVINRTLVYGALTASVVAIYVLVVGYLGALFRTEGNLTISLLATGLVAVLFAPLRDRMQRGVNRLMYGERDEPYKVLSRLGRRLEGTLAPEAVLPTIVENIARTLRLPHVAIWLADGEALRLGAAHSDAPARTTVWDMGAVESLRRASDGLHPAELAPSGEYRVVLDECGVALVLPLTHRGELVGALCMASRSPGETFSPADQQLLRDLATQAGAAAHAVQLTVALHSSLEVLRQSRERLVAAQEEERRRIQRDLHDGLGPVLASMRLRLEACLDAAQETRDPLTSDLERLYELVGQTTADIRRLVYNLRPPVLDQLGLVSAVKQHCERFGRETGIEVSFEAEENLSIPAAAEAALLRVVQEALLNVGKHAHASRVEVRLGRRDGWLVLEVRDEGVGFETNGHIDRKGTGIGSMRERVELLGGTLQFTGRPGIGTEVEARIPLPEVSG
ncbi:MAG TPA: GAF domain-containing sensor histidine kinase [Rubrobacteraceae bacterium]|nr:GAF domain-containing sensor histidine kinase [Rubrobacteraceae bacterium]